MHAYIMMCVQSYMCILSIDVNAQSLTHLVEFAGCCGVSQRGRAYTRVELILARALAIGHYCEQ